MRVSPGIVVMDILMWGQVYMYAQIKKKKQGQKKLKIKKKKNGGECEGRWLWPNRGFFRRGTTIYICDGKRLCKVLN